MATFPKPRRRLFMAGGFAVAIAIAPALATFAGPATPPAPHIVADCKVSDSPGNASLDCTPDVVPNDIGGAPSEMQLTEDNPGIASPEHR
jgi:hypothetical protein